MTPTLLDTNTHLTDVRSSSQGTIDAINNVLEFPDIVNDEALRVTIARGFASGSNNGNMPGCIGALDGIHIRIVKPLVEGSRSFFNYKGKKSSKCDIYKQDSIPIQTTHAT